MSTYVNIKGKLRLETYDANPLPGSGPRYAMPWGFGAPFHLPTAGGLLGQGWVLVIMGIGGCCYHGKRRYASGFYTARYNMMDSVKGR
jgi:hypothetical protein